MKSFHNLIIVSLFVTPIIFEAQATAQASPRSVASEFYTLVIRNHPVGLPNARQMRSFRPYLSRGLRSLFNRARKEQAEAMRAHPDDKPPNADGCLFSCLFEGPKRFRLGRSRVARRFAYVKIRQSEEPDGAFSWADTLVLVKENGRWLVWDIRMGCDWPFRMGPSLRVMLSGS
jgi:hypothetical protein